MSELLNVANEQEQEAQKNQQFWDKIYSEFNPQAPVQQTASSAPGFNQAAQNTQAFADQARQVAGNVGSSDAGAMSRGIQQTAGNLSRTKDLNSYLSDIQHNQGESNKYETQGLGRMTDIFGQRGDMNKLLMNRRMNQAKTKDDINNMWDKYKQGQTPWENIFGEAAGGALGKFAGSHAFGQGTPSSPTPDMPAYGLPDPENLFGGH